MRKSAFTIIEMLIAISIIGILSTMTILNLTESRAKSRDASRRSSVSAYTASLEVYYSVNKKYLVKSGPNCTYPADISLQDATASGSDCTGYHGMGYGAITRRGGDNYQTNSIADVLKNKGYLSDLYLDPRVKDFTTHNTTATEYDDYLLLICDQNGNVATTEKNSLHFAIYANLERPDDLNTSSASYLCGGPNKKTIDGQATKGLSFLP